MNDLIKIFCGVSVAALPFASLFTYFKDVYKKYDVINNYNKTMQVVEETKKQYYDEFPLLFDVIDNANVMYDIAIEKIEE